MINENGVAYNMGRMLRVRIQQKGVEKVVEYCPMADERLNARIDVVAKFLPAVGHKNQRTGLNAKVTIYNPPQEWVTMVQAPVWTLDYKNVNSYYAAKARVYVDAGYWTDSGEKAPQGSLGEEGGRAGYENIFGGYLNSSAYYRKGVDNILELYCFDISMNKMNQNEFNAVNEKYAALKNNTSIQEDVVRKRITDRMVGDGKISWTDFIFNAINHFATDKRPVQTYLGGIIKRDEQKQMSIANTLRTPEDKSIGKDIMLQYIKPPKNPRNPEEGAEFDGDLENLATNTGAGSNVVINAGNLDEAMEQIMAQFPGGLRWNVNYLKPAVSKNGTFKTPYYLWQPGNSGGNASKNTPLNIGNITKNTYIIYNFQNMLEAPSMDGSGCLNIKMLYNNQVKPNGKIALVWREDLKFKDSISRYTQGLKTTASQAYFHPSLQGGLMNDIVKAFKQDSGNIFNKAFTVGTLTHHLSTHTNNWFTELKTMSIGM